ncbi:hypothetical protein [Rhizobium sp. P44RR-XXIV]|uniref:hypothetical protein n=1 Tax=Rhizobium sp. P44RR-XXIV TaxID=1921145 RepID=UPI000984C46F|nr:hypothetical protein [Rhizobium sp. P44RR-XXIV]TIX91313.1 hypothetical protein BSK43_010080 [Rhizobium sp. P44RR-XXIV]
MKLVALPRSYFALMVGSGCLAWFLPIAMASAANAVDEQINHALSVEWAMGHCDQSQIPAMAVSVAAMTIQGAEVDTVERLRQDLRTRVAAYYPNPESACYALLKAFKLDSP